MNNHKIITIIISNNQKQSKTLSNGTCLREPPEVFVVLFIFDVVYFHLSSFVNVFHFVGVVSSFDFQATLHVTGTPPWLLRPVKVSNSSELSLDYFQLSFLFHLLQALRF